MWCQVPIEDLREMIRMCNPELWVRIERSDGTAMDPVWKLKKRIHDSRDVTPEDGSGFVSFLIEVEEDLMPLLIERCLGVLRIGATEGRLTGSGIVTEVRNFLGMDQEDKDKEDDENESENDKEEKADETDKKEKDDETDKKDKDDETDDPMNYSC